MLLALCQPTDNTAAITVIEVKDTTMDTRLITLDEKLDLVISSFSNEFEESMVIMNKDPRRCAIIRCFRCKRIGHLARDCLTIENVLLAIWKERSFSSRVFFKLPSANREGHRSVSQNFHTQNLRTKLLTYCELVSTSIFPSSLNFGHSAMIIMCIKV